MNYGACGASLDLYQHPRLVDIEPNEPKQGDLSCSRYRVVCCPDCAAAAEYAAGKALAYIARTAGRPLPWEVQP